MAVYPYLAVAVLLGWVENYLNAEVQVRFALFHVDVFFVAVTRVAKISDDLACGYFAAFLNVGGERAVFA